MDQERISTSEGTPTPKSKKSSEILSELTLRHARNSDYIFILSNYQKSFRNSQFAGIIRNNQYYSVMKNTLDDLLARGARCVIACDKLDSDNLVGFILFETTNTVPVIHYLFVKPDFRENGIAGYLLHSAAPEFEPFLYTHKTSHSKKFQSGYFSPVIARRKNLLPIYHPLDNKDNI